jgi:hypothetical protein
VARCFSENRTKIPEKVQNPRMWVNNTGRRKRDGSA